MGNALGSFFSRKLEQFTEKMGLTNKKAMEAWLKYDAEQKAKLPMDPNRVRPGYTNAEVDKWIEEDMARPENQPVTSTFFKGEKVIEKSTGQPFVVHDFTHQGVLLKHEGGAFKYGIKDEDMTRVK